MSVLIKGMEMPTRCAECWLMDGEDSWCTACRGRHLYPEYRYGIKDRPDWCPLVSVPEHGRLIDADATIKSEQTPNVTDEQWAQTTGGRGMSRYNRCKECFNMKCVFVTGERTDFDSSECADFRPMTNADRIRQMTDEELADRIMGFVRCEACEREFHIECNPLMTCRGVWLSWLKSPAEEADNG